MTANEDGWAVGDLAQVRETVGSTWSGHTGTVVKTYATAVVLKFPPDVPTLPSGYADLGFNNNEVQSPALSAPEPERRHP